MNVEDYKLNGVLDSPIDERDYTYDMVSQVSTDEVQIPKAFKLTYQFSPKNQGQVGSCVAHGVSEIVEMIRAMDKQLSPGYVYQNRLDTDFQGIGMIPREALSQLVNCGICLQELFPVNEEYPAIKETFSKYDNKKINDDAATRKSLSYVKLSKEEIKNYIYKEKKPVIVSVAVYESFYNTILGVVPEPSGNYKGKHVMVIIGWDEHDNFIVLNSWDKWGGNNGYLLLNINSDIYKEFWSLTDKPVIKPTPTPSPNSPIIKPDNATLYKVQIGAFKNLDNARALITELSKKDLACCIATYPTYYKVQLGAFKIKENAENLLKKVHDLGYIDAFIVTVI